MRAIHILLFKLLFLVCFGIVNTITPAYADNKPINKPTTNPQILDAEALKDGIDGRPYINPCDNFYEFACGQWLEQTIIPQDKQFVSRTTTPMEDRIDSVLNNILLQYAQQNHTSTPTNKAQLLGSYYLSCMNSDKEQERNYTTYQKWLRKIRFSSFNNLPLEILVAELHEIGVDIFFNFYSGQDLNDSTKVIGFIGQGGMGLPEKRYYFAQDDKSKLIRSRYLEYISQMLQLHNYSVKRSIYIANKILEFETLLAEKSHSLEEMNDPEKLNHPTTLMELNKLVPNFKWEKYFLSLKLKDLKQFNVDEPIFLERLNTLLVINSKSFLRDYMIWRLSHLMAPWLSGKINDLHFDFWNRFLNGIKIRRPRWQYCTREVSHGALSYALAESYVHSINGEKIKNEAIGMIAKVQEAFALNLDDLSWLDFETKNRALQKNNLISYKVGSPDVWRNFESLKLSDNNFLLNNILLNRFEEQRQLSKIGKPVDKSEWDMMPWELNAYFDPSNNEFVFPYGILQPPSLDLSASAGANLGSFGGSTIGHELTHGFDNGGRQFDGNGNLVNWWTELSLSKFKENAQCFIEQANQYQVKELGTNINGTQILDENLADQGGVKLGYIVLDSLLKHRAEDAPWLNRYSERQQYWIAYAQTWCTKFTPEALRSLLTTDTHPAPEYRVNGVLQNRPEFSRDFNCQPNTPMNPRVRCTLW